MKIEKVMLVSMNKNLMYRTSEFLINKNNIENEIRYWLWNIEVLGGWKIKNYYIKTFYC